MRDNGAGPRLKVAAPALAMAKIRPKRGNSLRGAQVNDC